VRSPDLPVTTAFGTGTAGSTAFLAAAEVTALGASVRCRSSANSIALCVRKDSMGAAIHTCTARLVPMNPGMMGSRVPIHLLALGPKPTCVAILEDRTEQICVPPRVTAILYLEFHRSDKASAPCARSSSPPSKTFTSFSGRDSPILLCAYIRITQVCNCGLPSTTTHRGFDKKSFPSPMPWLILGRRDMRPRVPAYLPSRARPVRCHGVSSEIDDTNITCAIAESSCDAVAVTETAMWCHLR
jgi:hypothetical protein